MAVVGIKSRRKAPTRGSKPGERRGGRQKGTPNKVTRELKDMILQALDQAGGVEYLKARAVDTPGPFLALIGKVLPTTLQGPSGEAVPTAVTFLLVQQEGAENRT